MRFDVSNMEGHLCPCGSRREVASPARIGSKQELNRPRFPERLLLGLVTALLGGISAALIVYGSGRVAIGGWVVLSTLVGLGLVGFVVCRK